MSAAGLEFPVHADVQEGIVSRALNNNIATANTYEAILKAVTANMMHETEKQKILQQAQSVVTPNAIIPTVPPILQQRGGMIVKESDAVDFTGRVATRKDVLKINPVHPLGIVRHITKVIRSGLDLPSTSNIRAYAKNLMPNHCLFKIICSEIINFDYDKELSTQFVLKPVINSDGITWLQTEKPFTNYLDDELPWEFKIGMPKMFRNLIIGDDKLTASDRQKEEKWDPAGWYMYINPFANRSEKMNTYKGHVSLSYAFLSADTDIKAILERLDIVEPFNDQNESHLCHVMTHVCKESDKFLTNNYNAVKLYNYKQKDDINTSPKYKSARGKRIGNKTLKPYARGKSGESSSSIRSLNKRSKNKFDKMVASRVLDHPDENVQNDHVDEENDDEDTDDEYGMNLPRDDNDDVIEE